MSRTRPFLAGLLSLPFALAALPAGAGSPIGDPIYDWSLYRYLSNGAGGFTGPELVDSGEQTGGALSEGILLSGAGDPHAEVFSSEGAVDFWARARSPHPPDTDLGQPIGARAELSVSQVFRKDAADATLSFSIPGSEIGAFHFGPENEGLTGIVVHSLEAGDFFAFFDEARLSGVSGDWTFTSGGTLPWEITSGGLDQGGVTVALPEPYERDIDLSSVLVGEEFAVTYHIIAEAVDTSQVKSSIRASAFEPSDETDGVSFAFDGVTPIGAPEPGGPLLLAIGAAALSAASRAPAPRAAGRAGGSS